MNQVRTKKGFTLMEMLFVVLVIALVISFSLPAIRSVRYDIKNSQAKGALKKLSEARQTHYQHTRGAMIQPSHFSLGSAYSKNWLKGDCTDAAASGVPGNAVSGGEVSNLFTCGFLNWKDFDGIPYIFYACDLSASPSNENGSPCTENRFVAAKALSGAGKKYEGDYVMYVDRQDMEVHDTLEDAGE